MPHLLSDDCSAMLVLLACASGPQLLGRESIYPGHVHESLTSALQYWEQCEQVGHCWSIRIWRRCRQLAPEPRVRFRRSDPATPGAPRLLITYSETPRMRRTFKAKRSDCAAFIGKPYSGRGYTERERPHPKSSNKTWHGGRARRW